MIKYEFPKNIQDLDYVIFPVELENAPDVFFHGTSESAFHSIVSRGFCPVGELASSSFVKRSPFALEFACRHKVANSLNGVVIAVRFPNSNAKGIRREGGDLLYLDDHEIQPSVVGYCVIPANYIHI